MAMRLTALLFHLFRFLAIAARLLTHAGEIRFRRALRLPSAAQARIPGKIIRYSRPKPPWVKPEVLRLAALSGAGCRTVEKLFNRIYASSRKMTVSKSYVHYTMRKHRYEIQVLRRKLKHRPPRPVPTNHVWALDLTGKGDVFGQVHSILGIVDHGSRRLLALDTVAHKNAWTLLGHVFLAIGRYGKPRGIRTDNDAVFRSRIFRTALKVTGIRHQLTVPGCPWMNGRIERVFGTLKEKLDCIKISDGGTLKPLLADFRFWYNQIRPHQNLGGLTPDEAWHGKNPYILPPKAMEWFEAWGGLLRGYYLRR